MIFGDSGWIVSFFKYGNHIGCGPVFGIIPCFNEAWKNSVNVGVSSSASVLSSLVGMWSGSVDLCF